MAARKSTRRTRVRINDGRCHQQLATLLRQLARIRAVVATAVLALEQQNADRDQDVASALQFVVIDGIASVEEAGWKLVGRMKNDERRRRA